MDDLTQQNVFDKDYSAVHGEAQDVFQYVCFTLNNQQFGINVENVIEVISIPEITNVIHTPDFIKGIINLRGEIIVVIDLKGFFSLSETELHEKSKIVVVKHQEKSCGFIVDSVSYIQAFHEMETDTLPATISGKMAEFLLGVANVKGKPLMILNFQSLFNADEFKQFE